MNQARGKSKSKTPMAVTQSIIDLKKPDPARGPRRISDILKRFFLVKASTSTVQRTLHEQGLTQPAKKKRKKNPARPRFFERATPNQRWISDIMTFRLAGKNAYRARPIYKWEQRGLTALLVGLCDQVSGRPEKPDTSTEQNLERQLDDLKRENQLLEQRMALKDLAAELNLRSETDRAKNK